MKKIFLGFLVALILCPAYVASADVGVNVYTGLGAGQNLFYGSAKNSNQGNLLLLQSRDGINEFVLDRDGNFWASSSVRSRNICNQNASYCFTPSSAGLDTTNDSWSGTGNITMTSGNVGIGTTTPNAKLHINKAVIGSGQDWLNMTTTAGAGAEEGFRFRTDNGFINHIVVPSGADLVLEAGNGSGPSLYLDNHWNHSSFSGDYVFMQGITVAGLNTAPPAGGGIFAGNVGIGTADPAYLLDVVNGTTWNDAPALSGTHAVTDYYGIGVEGTGKYIGVRGYCTAVSGGACYGASFVAYSGSSNSVGVSANGATYDFLATAGTGVDYGTWSSIRWKKDIVPIENSLGKVLNLRGVYFNWDEAHGGGHDMGMIAEEVGKQVPEIVVYEENGVDATGMDYGKLTPILVNAIKEQQLQIEELKKEIESLKK